MSDFVAGPLRWGVLGTGWIAKQFADDVPASAGSALHAVASRDLERAQRFAAEYGVIPYGSYDELLADDDVEAVYIALPNHLHLEWTTRCAESGKHVLCEKPIALNADQAVRAFDAAADSGVLLMEGFMYRMHPQIARLIRLIREGIIGSVRVMETSFGGKIGEAENVRLVNEFGGGAVLDLGSYGVSIARLVAGVQTGKPYAEPCVVKAAGHVGDVSRVDEWSAAVLSFDDGLVASVVCGNQVDIASDVRIWGSEGSIQLPNPWLAGRAGAPGRLLLTRSSSSDLDPVELLVPAERPLYAIEVDGFRTSLEEGQVMSPAMDRDDTVGNMRVLDRWRAELGVVFDRERDGQ